MMDWCWLFGHKWVVEKESDCTASCLNCGLIGSLKYLSMSGLKLKDVKLVSLRVKKDE